VRAGFARGAKAEAHGAAEAPMTPAAAGPAKSGEGARVSGLTPAAKAFWIAGAASDDARNELVLAVVPSDRDVEQITGDVRFFLGGLEVSSADELDNVVLPYPSQEVDPYRGLAPHLRIASARARALHAMAVGQARVVVASAAALLPRVSPPDALTALALDLRPGDDVDIQRLAGTLVDAGFTRQDPVDEHGEFCIRGGVIDIYPAGDDLPARIELVGDTIEAIRRYAPDTQRSVASAERLKVVPLREVVEGGGGLRVPFFDYPGAARRPVLVACEPDEIRERVEKQLQQIAESYAQVRSAAAATGRRVFGHVGEGSLAPSAPDLPAPETILVGWPAVDRHLASACVLEELGLDIPGSEAPGLHLKREERAPSAQPPPSPTSGQGPSSVGFGAASHVPCPMPHVPVSQPALSYSGRLTDWMSDVRAARSRGETVVFVAATHGRAERLIEVLDDYELRGVNIDRGGDTYAAAVLVTSGVLSRGFRLPAAQLQIFAETDLFEEERRARDRARRSAAKAFLSDLRDLKVGDLVVHVDNGIGEFVGLKEMTVGPNETLEFLELRYAGDDKLFVPVSRLDLVQKYSGGARPSLDRLGGTTWEKAKTRVKRAMRDMAEELLKLYAARKAVSGHAFSPDTHWQEEFESAFPFDLTADQQTAIEDIKRDMEAPTPMDRLLCGDVGYGKTEVSMRAAFKAVMDGKQVAYLAPTTVLAFQHVKTLRDRFAGFPVRIDLLSRFRSKAEQKESLADLAAGKVDICVGTHRLLSKDVVFRDLGLLVVDEEQRFGVAHKEKIKQLRKKVDVLTMTATPIPRTLNMSLVGIRDMSVIETPPKDRLAIQTHVVKFDQGVITRAVRNELARGGQVYFVHNRVESIFSIGSLLARLVPEARIVVGHGQMGEHDLERAMIEFMARKHDILLATTIVENGLDIPNVNTIIINRADRYGLSQLYQLRGRVGRSDRPAYAYLLVPPEISLSAVARKRLAAIREFSDLGSGFRVAALDLEIRGAGNLLGGEQSGHIDAVGFEMYMKLLEQAVRELKGEEIEEEARASVNLGIDIRVDEDYVPDMAQRLVLYRRVAAARTETEIGEVLDEIADRYGPLRDSVLNLAAYGRIRVLADKLGLESVDRQGSAVVLKFRDGARQASRAPDPARVLAVLRRRADVTLAPPSSLRLDLAARPARAPIDAPASRSLAQGGDTQASTRPGGEEKGSGLISARGGSSQRKLKPRASSPSWWTARATAGAVTPGFSKAEILKPPKENPLAEGGLFDRVGGLLEDLLR
jgi:transcription-repair coupling factor (superfamily II helicase)